ncbi:MAG: hypothetical protein ACI4JX_02630 [Oscillospiraceae bacterium]
MNCECNESRQNRPGSCPNICCLLNEETLLLAILIVVVIILFKL